MKPFGEQVLDELRRQGKYGEFFDFASYKRLHEVKDLGEMRAFLSERGFNLEKSRTDAIHIVDYLVIEQMKKQRWFGGFF